MTAKESLRKELEKGILCDGAFGTYYAYLYSDSDLPEKANAARPERVKKIHEEYIAAGARLIRSNTFALGFYRPDIAAELKELAAKGFTIASRTAKEHGVLAAANIGFGSAECAESAALAMAEAGAEIFNFESLADLTGLLPLLGRLKEDHPDACVIVSFCVDQFGYSKSGLSAGALAAMAQDSALVDYFGFNCGVGPGHLVSVLNRLGSFSKLASAMPNAGYATASRSVPEFISDTAYFAEKQRSAARLGVRMLGGCCGTTPAHIRALAGVFDGLPEQKREEKQPARLYAQPKSGGLCESGKKTIAVELVPPAGCSVDKLMDAAHLLAGYSVDIATFPDSPSGRTRVDSILMAVKVKSETGMRVMPHICCRDRNAIALRSSVMGAYINGVRDLLVITGDPVPQAIRGDIKSVFNFDSVGAMKQIAGLNAEQLAEAPVNYGGALAISVRNFSVEIERVKMKMAAGASFFMTQPVFSSLEIERLRYIREETGAKVLCGIMPPVSLKNALFTRNEIAGINVPDEVVSRFSADMTKEEGEQTGIAIAREVMEKTKNYADGYYFSLPFNRIYLLKGLL